MITGSKSNISIFLTGGTGLLGSHILQDLLQHSEVQIIALKRKSSSMDLVPDDSRITWMDANLDDVDILLPEIKKCSIVIHAAGMLSVHERDMDILQKINGKGTAHMINLAIEAKVDRFVHVSTVASLGREKDGLVTEDDFFEIHPLTSAYAKSKYSGDQEVYRGIAEGLSVNIIRPSLILGSGQWNGGSDSIIQNVNRGIPYYPGGGTGMVDVRDAAKMCRMMAFCEDDQLDIICNWHNLNFLEMQSEIAKNLGVSAPTKKLPNWIKGVIWRVEKVKSWLTGKPTILSQSSLERASNTYFYSNKKSKEVFQFEYRPWQSTIADSCEIFLEYQESGKKGRLPL